MPIDSFLFWAALRDFHWVYMEPPQLVLEQKNGLSFKLRPGSGIWDQIFLA